MTFQVPVGWLVIHSMTLITTSVSQLVRASNWFLGVEPVTFQVPVGWLVIHSMTLITTIAQLVRASNWYLEVHGFDSHWGTQNVRFLRISDFIYSLCFQFTIPLTLSISSFPTACFCGLMAEC